MGLAEPTKQSGSEEVDDDEDVRVSAVRDRKITTTIASAILVGGKLSTASSKVTLPEGGQDVRVKKVWIETTWLIKYRLSSKRESQFFLGTPKRVGQKVTQCGDWKVLLVIHRNGGEFRLIEEFRCECSQTQSGVAMLTTATKWAIFRAIFGIDKHEKICVEGQNKG